jgi:hypothetical protein
LEGEVLKLEKKNESATEGFKSVLHTYRTQTKEKMEAKDKIIQELNEQKAKLIEEIAKLRGEAPVDKVVERKKNEEIQDLKTQSQNESEAQQLRTELAKRDLEIHGNLVLLYLIERIKKITRRKREK